MIFIRTLFLGFVACAFGHALAQDPFNGRLLYTTPFAQGAPSCSASNCHGPDPTQNIARIQNGTTANDIFFAISRYGVMAFLQGRVSNQQATDLAAYIANPAAANNSAAAGVSTASLAFDTLFVGQTSRPIRLSILIPFPIQ